MSDDDEFCLKHCGQEYARWQREHHQWLEQSQSWKLCEQRVTALIFELDHAIPSHRMRIAEFDRIVQSHERQLEKQRQSFEHGRESMIDVDCPRELESFKRCGFSKCQACEPMCVEGLIESHHQADRLHEKMSLEHDRLLGEFTASRQEISRLANDLLVCINKE